LARCLIVGCGCRGRALASELRRRGHVVRGTTRRAEQLAEIEGAGVEAVLADPDRVATLALALDHVGVACILLGSASASADQLRALHGPRLEMLLVRVLDTTVRGVVYEASGSVPGEVLGAGAAIVRGACATSQIRYSLLDADPADHRSWLAAAARAVESTL
jgi:nucleoside-diphosphate-sugar epimerase